LELDVDALGDFVAAEALVLRRSFAGAAGLVARSALVL
jgi:hypothetical protein